ncbi:hypothetical protein GCM10025771_04820 [Niveibacterium umoris]|uniref:Hemerythrin-like metal-binding protein n=1 Tax=Niveibacterium umoris TaxID=1193620 RepID=A0A840BQM3_9RHOO|nr:cation-binding hemerythrin HHE [Niveibacterium umoris]MBB4013972.1 hemerythrin-like metal-binding protein [Niveibacterium umoris]
MTPFELTPDLLFGHRDMDTTHEDFVWAVNALRVADDDTMGVALDALIAHCESHFAQENAWAAAIGFPGCHANEHERVLAVMRAVRVELDKGDHGLGRRLAEELPVWFKHHAASMDAALAAMLKNGLTMADIDKAPIASPCGGSHACKNHDHHDDEHDHACHGEAEAAAEGCGGGCGGH